MKRLNRFRLEEETTVPDLQLDLFIIQFDSSDLEINT